MKKNPKYEEKNPKCEKKTPNMRRKTPNMGTMPQPNIFITNNKINKNAELCSNTFVGPNNKYQKSS